MPIIIATAGTTLLGFLVGIGVPMILGFIARLVLLKVNENAGAKLCSLRDLPWALTSVLSIPLVTYPLGIEPPSVTSQIITIALVLPLIPCLIAIFRCVRQEKSRYIIPSCLYAILSIYSMLLVVPLTINKRSV